MNQGFHPINVVKVQPGSRASSTDLAATEEPLEIRLNGEPFVVTMRTPGDDINLAAGFLFSERVIFGVDDLGAIEHLTRDAAVDSGNVVDATLAGDAARRLPLLLEGRRRVTTNSSCGICCRRTIAAVLTDAPAVTARWQVPTEFIGHLPARLRDVQPVFDHTGGLHGAGLFSYDGTLELTAEDVGRHNAVDKVIGRMLFARRLPLDHSILVISGRAAYEIVQKAFLAGIPMIASVSAPSTLAIDLARHAGITLLGFVRDGCFNIYTHGDRVGA